MIQTRVFLASGPEEDDFWWFLLSSQSAFNGESEVGGNVGTAILRKQNWKAAELFYLRCYVVILKTASRLEPHTVQKLRQMHGRFFELKFHPWKLMGVVIFANGFDSQRKR